MWSDHVSIHKSDDLKLGGQRMVTPTSEIIDIQQLTRHKMELATGVEPATG